MKSSEKQPFRSAKAKEQYLESYDKLSKKYWPLTSESKMVDTSFGQTFVLVSGEDVKPPMVLLPGGNNTSLMWWQNIKALSEHYKTYAVDNISDFGRSIPQKDTKNPDDFMQWLNELFDALDLPNNINLIGLSYGGWLTSLYALNSPERLNKIVLLAPAATVQPLCKEFWVRVLIRMLIPHRHFTKSMMYWICEDLHRKDKAGQVLLEDAIDDLFNATRWFKTRKLPAPTVLTDKELSQITIPALYLVGENEKIYSPDKAVERLNNVAPQINTEIIPETGHDLVFVQPDLISEKILEFLK